MRHKFIGVWTRNILAQTDSATREFLENWLASRTIDDWFYNVEYDGQMFFIADNGEFGYTAMMPDDY